MSLILLLLKIIFIIFISLILFILFIALLVIFVPVKYEINVDKNDSTCAKIIVTWLFPFIYLKYTIENKETKTIVAIFGYKIIGNNKNPEEQKKKIEEKKKKIEEKKKKIDEKKKKTKYNNKSLELKNNNTIDSKIEDKTNNIDNTKKIDKKENKVNNKNDNKKENTKQTKSNKFSFNLIKKIAKLPTTINEFFINIKDRINDAIERINEFNDYPNKREIINYSLTLLKELVKSLLPKKYLIELELGFNDPSITGQTIGALYVIKAFLPIKAKVIGNFDEKCFKTRIYAKDYLSIWDLLLPILKYITKKPIWNIIKLFLNKKRK